MLRNSTLSRSPGSAVGMRIGPDRSAGVAERGHGWACSGRGVRMGEECASVQLVQWTCVRSTCLTSSAESSFLIWPPVQSIILSRRGPCDQRGERVGYAEGSSPERAHSTLKTSPSSTVATGGMSGCQRLWSGGLCSHGLSFVSTVSSFLASGMMDGVGVQVLRRGCAMQDPSPPSGTC